MRTKYSLAALIMAAALFAPGPARASDLPSWSVSLLGGYEQYSNKMFYPADSLADAPVAGLRIGCTFGEYWTLEAAGSYGSTHGVKRNGSDGPDVTVINASANLVGQLTPGNRYGSVYLSGGFGYNQYDAKSAPDNLHFGVLEAALGWKKWLNSGVGFQLEARNLLNLPQKNLGTANLADQQYWGGIMFGWGGKPKDTDGDGVPDKKDKCPDTPKGATANATGCPTDSDGDGVWDGLDQCANTAKGATVNATGCPTDTDGDGVFDGLDQCPDTPKGATVDAKGCPLDSDGDGVFDGLDKCADTAAGLKVDATGCPIEVTEKETELLDTGMIRLQNVNFETGKSNLLPESFSALDEVGRILSKWPQLKIEIGGHTDSRGAATKNQVLSEDRAQAVKDYLLDKFPGLDKDQLSVRGYGFSKPLVKNSSALNMAKNRRVEFKVLNRDALKKEIERRKMLQK